MSARTDIWMPLYIGDYLSDTMHLSTEQHGAYLLLLMHAWKAGGNLPVCDRKLSVIARLSLEQWREIKDDILAFFEREGECFTQKRLRTELSRATRHFQSRRENGKLGGRPRKETCEKPTGYDSGKPKPNRTETPSQSQSQSHKSELLRNSHDGAEPHASAVLDYLNERAGSQFKTSKTSLQNINARLREGHTPAELQAVIDFKVGEWAHRPDMRQYLRPQTLFAPGKFPGYLAAATASSQPRQFSDVTYRNARNLEGF